MNFDSQVVKEVIKSAKELTDRDTPKEHKAIIEEYMHRFNANIFLLSVSLDVIMKKIEDVNKE